MASIHPSSKRSPCSSFGYHCNGECFKRFGGDLGLVEDLTKSKPLLLPWFVNAEWAKEPPRRYQFHLERIHPIQFSLGPERDKAYEKNEVDSSSFDDFERYPVLFDWMGKRFVFQGTHRLAALAKAGETVYQGYLLSI